VTFQDYSFPQDWTRENRGLKPTFLLEAVQDENGKPIKDEDGNAVYCNRKARLERLEARAN
jgi:hypothetical protein